MRVLLVPSVLSSLLPAAGCVGGSVSSLGAGAGVHRVKKQNTALDAFRPVSFAALAAKGRGMRNEPVRVRALVEPAGAGRVSLRDPGG